VTGGVPVRRAVAEWTGIYNEQWLIERTPAEVWRSLLAQGIPA
jgi:hypothetical protein